MKKLIMLVMIFISTFTIINVINAETAFYDTTIIVGKTFSLQNGVFTDNSDFVTTDRIKIIEKNLTLTSLNFTYILFFDNQNVFMGYYKTSFSTYENLKFLGNITNTTVIIPSGATKFSITANIIGDEFEIAVPSLDFYSVQAEYNYQEGDIIETNILDKLENILQSTGLGKFGLVLFALIIMGILTFLSVKISVNLGIIFLLNGLVYIFFTVIGWFPSWTLIIFTLGLILLIFIKKGGGE